MALPLVALAAALSAPTPSFAQASVPAAQQPQSISFTAPATGYTGESATLTATGGGSGNPVTFSVDSSSGAGVCSVSGDIVSYVVVGTCVIDANQAGNASYAAAPQVSQTLTVSPGLSVPPYQTISGEVGQPLSESLTANGGQGPYTFALAPGTTLPPGLTLNPDGQITGTPTQASGTLGNFTVTDSENPAVTVTAVYATNIALGINPPTLPDGYTGQPYSQQLTAVGTTASLAWELAGGSLPPGLTLSPAGLLSGTPTTQGSYTFNAYAYNMYAGNGTATYTLTINPGPQAISFSAPATGTVGQSVTLTATGGGSGNPVVFSVDPSSGAGVCNVSGTNGTTLSYAAAGSCVIDANQAGNATYTAAPQVTATITVDQAPAFVMDSPPLTAVAGQEYSYTFAASGTPAPGYALAAGAPSWLSVGGSTGQVTGTPPAGTTSFSYSVTAANTAGTVTAGPLTVTVARAVTDADVSVAMSCPSRLTVGSTGTCTLTVSNAGPAAASNAGAAVLLPAALSEVSCTSGCARHGNVFTWSLGTLASGASASVSITVEASRTGAALVLAVAASQNPDPRPLNNIAIALIRLGP